MKAKCSEILWAVGKVQKRAGSKAAERAEMRAAWKDECLVETTVN